MAKAQRRQFFEEFSLPARRATLIFTVAFVLLEALAPRVAWACGATPFAWWTFDAPAVSAATSPDGVVVLRLRSHADYLPNRSTSEILNAMFLGLKWLDVDVTDAAGAPVFGHLRPFGGEVEPAVVFAPLGRLPANTTLQVHAALRSPTAGARPAGVVGETEVDAMVSVGATPQAPLQAAGEVRAEVTKQTFPPYRICGCGCLGQEQPYEGHQARLELPVVTGGFTVVDYDVVLAITGTPTPPERSAVGAFAKLAPGVSRTVTFELRPGRPAGEPTCFHVSIEDAVGQRLALAPACLNGVPVLAPPPAPIIDVVLPPPPRAEPVEGCSFAPGAVGSGGGAWVVFGALTLVMRWRRVRRAFPLTRSR